MFYLTLLFIAVLAGLIVCLVDIPRVAELAIAENIDATGEVKNVASGSQSQLQLAAQDISRWLFYALLLMWPVYWIEFVWIFFSERKANSGRLNANSANNNSCLLYTSPSPRDATLSRMPSSA